MSPVEEKNGTEVTAEKSSTLDDAKARIPRNVAWNWASFGFTIGVSLLIAPLLVHRLGEVKYGIWALIGDFVGYSWLLGFGLGYAVVRYVARYYALDDRKKLSSVVSTSFFLNLGSSALVTIVAVGAAYVFPHLFSIPASLILAARMTVLIVAVTVIASFPASVFSGCLAAASRYDRLALRSIVPTAVRALLLWYFLENGYGLLAVALVTTGAASLGILLELRFAKQQFPELEITPKHFDFSLLRPLASFSLYGFLLSVASRVIYMTDNLVVGFVLGPAAVAFYAVGAKLPAMLRGSMGNITKLYFPFASQMDALGKKEGLKKLYLAGTRIASLYVFAGAAGLVALGRPFLDLWMGKSFGQRSTAILILLASEVALFALTAGSGQVLYGMNRHKFNAWLSISNAAANFTLSVILVRTMGAIGVAWGTLIPSAVAEGIILPLYTGRLLGVSVWRFYYQAALRPLAAVAPFAAWLWMCREHGFASGYIELFIITGLGLVLYAAAAWALSLDAPERAAARRWMGRARSRVATAFA